MPELYDLLDLAEDASPDEVKRAYRRKAREHHPDAGGDEEAFKAVTHAYQVLSDPEKRARYDRFGDDGTPGSRGGQDPFGFGGAGFGGINDVIDAFFGAGAGAGPGGGRGPRQRTQPGRDVLVVVDLTLEEVVTGVGRDLEVDVARGCDTCGGSGAADGAGPSRCRTCGGAGQVQRVVRTAFGQLATAAPCGDCQGAGTTVTDPCTDCRGEGRRATTRTLEVQIPAGLEDGDRIPVRGEGEAGRQGAPPGDLYVQIRVAEHELFVRDGRNVVAEVTVPVTQAALGGTLQAPTLDGEQVEVPLPAGTQPGDVLTVRRAGLPVRGGGRRGDLQLLVRVAVPTGLDEAQRRLLAELAELRGEELRPDDRGLFSRLRGAFQR
ncbi:MAG: J domain-containing protein [Nitriliruptoraceae bacterium]|nr:J domain-containing protein [Nitriliruptoraceae bacterium]